MLLALRRQLVGEKTLDKGHLSWYYMGMDNTRIQELRKAVEAGGGVWLGVQETIEPPALVLFNSPTTGSTLAIFEDVLSEDIVRKKIERSDRNFLAAPVRISRKNFERLIEHARGIEDILLSEEKQ